MSLSESQPRNAQGFFGSFRFGSGSGTVRRYCGGRRTVRRRLADDESLERINDVNPEGTDQRGGRLKRVGHSESGMLDAIRPLSVELSDVWFVHWPVSPRVVRSRIPEWTEPDTVDGSAWVSALALSMDRFDVFGVPVREAVEGVNLRTYVTTPSGERAVSFLSLDVTDRLAADAARRLFRLPYHEADVRRRREGDRTEVVSRRREDSDVRLAVTFEPVGEPAPTAPDTLASFLVERDRYVTTGPFGRRLVGSVGHPPWSVQPADVTVTERTLLDAAGVDEVEGSPLVHHSPGLEMTIGSLEPL